MSESLLLIEGSDSIFFTASQSVGLGRVCRLLLSEPLIRTTIFAPPALHHTPFHCIAADGRYNGRRTSSIAITFFEGFVISPKAEKYR
jgi:hypothetical protein